MYARIRGTGSASPPHRSRRRGTTYFADVRDRSTTSCAVGSKPPWSCMSSIAAGTKRSVHACPRTRAVCSDHSTLWRSPMTRRTECRMLYERSCGEGGTTVVRAAEAREWAPGALRGMIDSLYTPFSGAGGEQIDEPALRGARRPLHRSARPRRHLGWRPGRGVLGAEHPGTKARRRDRRRTGSRDQTARDRRGVPGEYERHRDGRARESRGGDRRRHLLPHPSVLRGPRLRLHA